MPAPDRHALLLDLLASSAADVGVAFQMAAIDGDRLAFDVEAEGDGLAPALAAATAAATEWPNLTLPSSRDLAGFAEYTRADPRSPGSLLDLSGTPVELAHELRLLVYAEGRLVGVLAYFRRSTSGPFPRSARRAVQSAASRARAALVGHARAHDAETEDLDGLLVLDPEGGLVLCTDQVRRWLDRGARPTVDPNATGEQRTVATGAEVRLLPVHGPGGRAFSGRVRQIRRPRLSPDAVLSPTQRRVAEYAAVGATVSEIARTLDAAAETVRSHLKEVYRRLEVASRLELAEVLQGE
jgi:DNA-binding CsgD family transcriptional regulator